ncbi:MAG: hypothetical protein DRH10_06940 [Deltaproteobacteria bacterium]|nr:MAG: hypothetical protein DRH10_06940 [Deltaproteobacteria bacterium]
MTCYLNKENRSEFTSRNVKGTRPGIFLFNSGRACGLRLVEHTLSGFLAAGCWLLGTGCWLLDAGSWLLDTCCWILAVMIAYDLQCSNGHTFEGWFDGRQAFEEQMQKKLIACPVCNDTNVVVVPSTFAVHTGGPQRETPDEAEKSDKQPSADKIIEFLEKNFEDVGLNFAKEALKMHYGVSEKRNIRGISTKSEEEMLKKEGIKFFKIPVPQLDS